MHLSSESSLAAPFQAPVASPPPAEAPGLLGAVSGCLALRIRGTNRNGQIVRLHGQKCAIGSSKACTLRIRGLGTKPLHCLILRGEQGTAIRRCSSDTQLNGQPFSDAALFIGDRLTLGAVELEVLEGASSRVAEVPSSDMGSPGGESDSAAVRLAQMQAHDAQAACAALEQKLAKAREDLAQEQSRAAAERARLQAEASAHQTQFEQFEGQLADARRQHQAVVGAAAEATVELARRDAEWRAADERRRAELDRLRDERDSLVAAQVAGEAQRATLDAELAGLRDQRRGTETILIQERHSFREDSVRSEAEIARTRGELTDARENHRRQMGEWEQERESLLAELAAAEELRQQLDQARQEGALKNERQSSLEAEIAGLREDAARRESQRQTEEDQLRRQLDEIRQERENLLAERASKDEWQSALEAELAQVQEESARREADQHAATEQLRQQLERSRQDHDALHARLAAQAEKQSSLEKEFSQFRDEAMRSDEERQAAETQLREQLDAAQRERENVFAEGASSSEQQHLAEAEMARQREEFERQNAGRQAAEGQLREELELSRAELARLEEAALGEAAALREEHSRREAELAAERTGVEAEVRSLREEVARLSEELLVRSETAQQVELPIDASPISEPEPLAEPEYSPGERENVSQTYIVPPGGFKLATLAEEEAPAPISFPQDAAADAPLLPPPLATETPHAGPPAKPPAAAPAEEAEESIEEYMQRLLQRSRGETAPLIRATDAKPLQCPQMATTAAPSPVVREAKPASESPTPAAPAVASEGKEPQEYSPRSTAPESSDHLAVMRELANTSTRSAIDHSVRRRGAEELWSRLVFAGVSLTAGASLAIYSGGRLGVPLAAGCIGLASGLWWSSRLAMRLLKKPGFRGQKSEVGSQKSNVG